MDTFFIVMWTHLIVYWTSSIFFLFFNYYCQSHSIVKYNHMEGKRPVPDIKNIYKAIMLSISNQIISIPVIYFTIDKCHNENAYTYVYAYILIFLVLADQWFYWIHRLCHYNKIIFKYIHSLHHHWTYPIAVSTLYVHPLEHIIINLGSFLIGPLLFPTSNLCLCIWTAMSTLNSVIAHGGTKIISNDGTHDLHHRFLIYNFGVLGVSDRMFGTFRSS